MKTAAVSEFTVPNSAADVDALVASGADINVSYPSRPGWTHLHTAAYGPPVLNIPVMEALLATGANVDAVETLTGMTPLHVACLHGRPEAVRLLLAAGADRSICDHAGKTPIETAGVANRGDDDGDAVIELMR